MPVAPVLVRVDRREPARPIVRPGRVGVAGPAGLIRFGPAVHRAAPDRARARPSTGRRGRLRRRRACAVTLALADARPSRPAPGPPRRDHAGRLADQVTDAKRHATVPSGCRRRCRRARRPVARRHGRSAVPAMGPTRAATRRRNRLLRGARSDKRAAPFAAGARAVCAAGGAGTSRRTRCAASFSPPADRVVSMGSTPHPPPRRRTRRAPAGHWPGATAFPGAALLRGPGAAPTPARCPPAPRGRRRARRTRRSRARRAPAGRRRARPRGPRGPRR